MINKFMKDPEIMQGCGGAYGKRGNLVYNLHSAVALSLEVKELSVSSAKFKELSVGAELDHPSPVEDEDTVGHTNGRKPVRDKDCGFPLSEFGKSLKHLMFGPCIEGGCRFIEDKELCVAHIRAGERDLLPFTVGELHAVLEPFPEHLVVFIG